MKFSVVIPCHDRLELLREAVYTVLQQDWTEWELIIFDNASKSELADYVRGLADPRIRYDRSDEFLSVTESWNRAIDMATGDYVVFLGDDDGLTPNYFSRMLTLIEKFGNPEIVYSAIYQFIHPGVAPWARGGYVAEVKNGFFFVGQKEPFMLSPEQAFKAVKGSVDLRRNFTFNIQAWVFSRRFIRHLKQDGPFFRSPFPDYYIANIALAKSKSVLVVPEPMCIAGVSKASVGYALFNGLEDRFSEILNMGLSSDPLYKDVEGFLLPGPPYNNNYILTMEHIVRYASTFLKCKVNYSRYRRLQIYLMILHNMNQGKNLVELVYWDRLGLIEKLWTLKLIFLLKLTRKSKICERLILSYLQRSVEPHAFRALTRTCNENSYHQLIQVFDDLRTGILS